MKFCKQHLCDRTTVCKSVDNEAIEKFANLGMPPHIVSGILGTFAVRDSLVISGRRSDGCINPLK